MSEIKHLTAEELAAGFDEICQSPADGGVLEMIVRRPTIGEREVITQGELTLDVGLAGDNWKSSDRATAENRTPHIDSQLTVMNARTVALVAQTRDRWPLAGDQLFVDLDLSTENLPPGTQLSIGTAVIQVTAEPHTGCKKFIERYGQAAMKFVNSPAGRARNLRGINTTIIQPGVIKVGDLVKKV